MEEEVDGVVVVVVVVVMEVEKDDDDDEEDDDEEDDDDDDDEEDDDDDGDGEVNLPKALSMEDKIARFLRLNSPSRMRKACASKPESDLMRLSSDAT